MQKAQIPKGYWSYLEENLKMLLLNSKIFDKQCLVSTSTNISLKIEGFSWTAKQNILVGKLKLLIIIIIVIYHN